MNLEKKERARVAVQVHLDKKRTQLERNRLGQFATPVELANAIAHFGTALLADSQQISFLDPAIGTGAFFSALVSNLPEEGIANAQGFEIDNHYGMPAQRLWQKSLLNLRLEDFTKARPPLAEDDRFNFILCNPPYVRHHHMPSKEKVRLQRLVNQENGLSISGLAGLYCYFLILSHSWMRADAIAGWLIPGEFMDVNYGKALKDYLLNQVTTLRIHRFDPAKVQFSDATVSSVLVWIRNRIPPKDHNVEFTFGNSLHEPQVFKKVPASILQNEKKWTKFHVSPAKRSKRTQMKISDLFTIKRGIATGGNKFFILPKERILELGLPTDFLRPVLPGPRYVTVNEIPSADDGTPLLDKQLYLLDCHLPEDDIRVKFPNLYKYLESGKPEIANRYLCRSRRVWYFQEQRMPAPVLCSYLGRSKQDGRKPFRFFLNHSKAIATNVYLMMYPKPALAKEIDHNSEILEDIWKLLNDFPVDSLLSEGRVYGGGLYKLEPKELGNVDATPLLNVFPGLLKEQSPRQRSLFNL